MVKLLLKNLNTNELRSLTRKEWMELLTDPDQETIDQFAEKAREISKETFSNEVYTRGLIELTNYCKNDCYYCGIRKSNLNANRYRLTKEEILACCANGYDLGFRTFVLQIGRASCRERGSAAV